MNYLVFLYRIPRISLSLEIIRVPAGDYDLEKFHKHKMVG